MPWSNEAEINKDTVRPSSLKEKYLDSVFVDGPNSFDIFSESEQPTILKGVKDFIVTSLSQLKTLVPFEEFLLKESSILYLSDFDIEKWRTMGNHFKNIIT